MLVTVLRHHQVARVHGVGGGGQEGVAPALHRGGAGVVGLAGEAYRAAWEVSVGRSDVRYV